MNKIDKKLDKVDQWMHKHIMDKYFWHIVRVLTLILIAGGVLTYIDYTNNPDVDNTLALQLNASGWELYTSSKCSYCDEQKDIIGSLDGLITYECDTNQEDNLVCLLNNVTVVPTWLNIKTGEGVVGMQTIDQLESMVA